MLAAGETSYVQCFLDLLPGCTEIVGLMTVSVLLHLV
jgi:hypothetical protein